MKSTSAATNPPPFGVGVAVTVRDGSPGAPGTMTLTVGVGSGVFAACWFFEPPQPARTAARAQTVSLLARVRTPAQREALERALADLDAQLRDVS